MAREGKNGSSLHERVNNYLRSERSKDGIFAAPVQAAETDLKEYLLERAEAELRATQVRIEELKQELARMR